MASGGGLDWSAADREHLEMVLQHADVTADLCGVEGGELLLDVLPVVVVDEVGVVVEESAGWGAGSVVGFDDAGADAGLAGEFLLWQEQVRQQGFALPRVGSGRRVPSACRSASSRRSGGPRSSSSARRAGCRSCGLAGTG